VFVILLAGIALLPVATARAACPEQLANDKGQAKSTIDVSNAGKYSLQLRMLTPKAENDSVYVQIDDRCPVDITSVQYGPSFVWVSHTTPIELTAGSHTITLAGHKAGAGVDKVMLVSDDSTCQPNDDESCVGASQTKSAAAQAGTEVLAAQMTNWWLTGGSIAVGLGALGFMAFKYVWFLRRMQAPRLAHKGVVVGGGLHPETPHLVKIKHFARHHRVTVIVCAGLLIGATTVGIVNAADTGPAFEAESASLVGGTTVAASSDASGGKYIIFTPNPPGTSPTAPAKSGSTSGGTATPSAGQQSGGSAASTPQTDCAPVPSKCSYPDASNTGVPADTSLTVMDLAPAGYMDITTPGAIIENKDIRGCLVIKAANVTIRKSKITCNSFYAILSEPGNYSGGGLLIEDSEISCDTTTNTGMSEYGFTARRIEVSGCENGFSITNDVTIEDSYIHSLYEGPSGAGHADGIQMAGTPTNVMIRHNTILVPATTAAVNWTGPTNSVTIDNNLLGGGAYTVYCPRQTIATGAYKVINNRFAEGMGAFGLTDDCDGGDVTFTGNYKDSNLSAVTP
jgi:hypothetical protein